MKKLFILSGFIFINSLIFAQPDQQIKNGGFETWEQLESDYGKYWDFGVNRTDMLRTLNSLYGLGLGAMFTTKLTSFRETQKEHVHSGQYSLRMQSVYLEKGDLFVPGAMGTISPDFINEFLDLIDGGKIGVFAEFGSRPKGLKGYYKYTPVNGDSAAIEIELRDYNMNRVGSALWIEKNTVSEWTHFDIEINYTANESEVFELKLIFSASAGYNFDDLENCKGQVGSRIWFDDIAFRYEDVGLLEPLMDRTHSKVYPNPATTSITISFDKVLDGKLVIYNVLGAEVTVQAVSGNTVETNISHLASGSYFYRIIDGNLIRTSGKFLVE